MVQYKLGPERLTRLENWRAVLSCKKTGILPLAKNHLKMVVTWSINLLDAFIKQPELKSNTASLFIAFILFSASLTDWVLTLYLSSCNSWWTLFLVYFAALYLLQYAESLRVQIYIDFLKVICNILGPNFSIYTIWNCSALSTEFCNWLCK